MRVSQARTIVTAPMRPVAIIVLTVAALMYIFLATTAAFDQSPFHVQHEVYRYGVALTLR